MKNSQLTSQACVFTVYSCSVTFNYDFCLTWLTWLTPCHSRWSRGYKPLFIHPVLSWASIFLQLYLNPAVPISDSGSPGIPWSPSSVALQCKACLTMLLSFFCNVCPSQLHFLLLQVSVLVPGYFLSICHCCWFCSGQYTLTWGTGIRWLMRGMATLPQGNQELLVVRDKVGRPRVSLG